MKKYIVFLKEHPRKQLLILSKRDFFYEFLKQEIITFIGSVPSAERDLD